MAASGAKLPFVVWVGSGVDRMAQVDEVTQRPNIEAYIH